MKYDVGQEAFAFVRSFRNKKRRLRTRNDSPGFFEIQQERASAITRILVGAMVKLEPALGRFDRSGAGTHPFAVPFSATRADDCLMAAPVEQVIG